MRHPGDSSAGQPASQGSGRHRDSAGRDAPGRRGQPATRPDSGPPDAGPSVFGPGYRGQRPATGTAGGPGGNSRAASGPGGSSKGPVRGFPPAPGQPAPLYPPGQFAAWNRMSAARAAVAGSRAGSVASQRPDGTGRAGADGHSDEIYQPDYSALAVSDPAADVTSTQTWQVISPDGPGTWTSPRGSAAVAADPVTAAADAAGAAAEAAAPAAAGWPEAGPDGPGLTGPADGAPGGRSGHSRGEAGRSGNRAAGTRGSGRHGSAPPAGPEERAAGSRVASRAGSRSGRSARKGRPASAVLAVCAVLVVAIAAGAFLLHAAEHQGTPATADRSAAAPGTAAASPSPTLGQFGHIATRAADPLPLTVAQLFPDTFTTGGVVFSRTTSEPKGSCASAVIGTALQAAVPAATCSQVVRASYLATSEKAMGTIGVLNLGTAATAAHAGHAADTGDFIAQLKGPSGPTRALGQGAGLEEAATKGHYLILIWAQFVNSASPKSPAQQAQLKTFMTQLFDETANVSLSNRMVSGTP